MNSRRHLGLRLLVGLLLALLPALRAEETTITPGIKLDSLPVGKARYERVQVRSMTVHTAVITHSGGMASILLRDLSPEWQARFNYDAAADAASELAAKASPLAAKSKATPQRAAQPKQSDVAQLLQRFGQPAAVRDEVNLRPKYVEFGLGVRDQGRRPSCSIFAIVCALEFENAHVLGRGQNFSEEYLIWATQKTVQRTPVNPLTATDATPEDADLGFSLTEVVTALRAYGIPLQSSMPNNFSQSIRAIGEPPPEIVREAREHQRVFVHQLPGRDAATRINNLVHALNAGIPVAIGLAWPNWHAVRTGYLSEQKPMQNAWHAVTIVGYRSKTGRIEDTYFIFKNSWGSIWGQGGYGTVTYGYLNKYLDEAVLLEVQRG